MEKSSSNNGKVRQSNFELLRIIAMIMIIIHHFNLHGGVLNNLKDFTFEYYFINILEIFCIIAVNLYVLITGYFMVKSKFKISKILKLELEVIFYSIITYIVLVFMNKLKFNIQAFIKFFLPVTTNQYWFMTAYILLYLLTPILNILINNINQKQYKYLLIVLFFSLSIIQTVYPENSVVGAIGGFSLIWFIFLYLVGGYIRLYYNGKYSKLRLFGVYIASIILQILIKIGLEKINLGDIDIINIYKTNLLNYNNILILIESVTLFLIFAKIKINNKIINYISSSTLAIYLIHDQNNVRGILWNYVSPYKYVGSSKIYLVLIISVLGIFIGSIIIDKIRIIIFKQIGKLKFIQKIGEKVDNLKIID